MENKLSFLSFFVMLLLVGMTSTWAKSVESSNPQSSEKFSLKELQTVGEVFEEMPSPHVTSWLNISRKDGPNFFCSDIEAYIREHGVRGIIRGLCDSREILDGGVVYNDREFIEQSSVQFESFDKVRYCDVFAYMFATNHKAEPIFRRSMGRDDRDTIILTLLKDALEMELREIRGGHSVNRK